jgi:hypothetical protein
VPSFAVGVADEEDPFFGIDEGSLRAERQPARQPPVAL